MYLNCQINLIKFNKKKVNIHISRNKKLNWYKIEVKKTYLTKEKRHICR